jgi:general secretion pathway protein D
VVRSLSRRAMVTMVLCLLAVISGCAQQRVRDNAQDQLRLGQYEQAVASYEAGLRDYPDSAMLRAGLLQARREALSRLLAEAGAARASGQYAQAEQLLLRAKAMEPTNSRIHNLLADLATEQRQRAALAEAEKLFAEKRQAAALRVVEQALKDNPRNPELVNLQRRIELDVRQAQVRAAQSGLAETRPISVDFRDAGLRTVLDVVSRNSGINFILDKDIRADTRVTVLLRSAKVEDAIDLIVSTHQLAKKVVDPQTILIYPNTPEKQREHQEQVVKVFYLASAEAKGAAAFLRSMLRIRDPFVDERTNMLALRDTADNIYLAERLVALYDAQEPEVMLEVEVIEISSSRLTELGVKFPDTFTLTPLAPPGAARLTLGNVESLTRNDIALSVGGLLVNLRRELGDFNTLANPRVRAKSKEKAKIMIGDKIPVITVTASGTGGFVSDSVNYIDVGLKLEVEPTVYADDDVSIRIGLEVSSLGAQVRTTSGSLAYQIGTRNASTLLRLRDGETQILAGLISSQDRSASARVPGIGDLPLLGRLFSNQRDDGQRTELVLAITPRIVRSLRRPDANETELWVGTEISPRLRAVEGRLTALSAPPAKEASPADRRGSAVPATATVPAAPAEPASALPAAPTLSWRGIPAEVKQGDTFVATLMLSTPTPLRGVPVQLSFSKDKLSVVDVEEGDLLKQGGAATSFSRSIDADAGRVQAGGLRNQATGASGQGSLLSVRFRAMAAGTAELSVVGTQPLGLEGMAAGLPAPAPARVVVK